MPEYRTPNDSEENAVSQDHSFRLDGAAIVVTGASSGIGAEIARTLGASGARVLLVGRDEQRLHASEAAVRATGAEAASLALDVCGADAPERVVAVAREQLGDLTGLVHAAGIFEPTPFAATADECLDRQWEVNVRAPFRLTRAAVPHLTEGASVTFVSSIAGHVGFPNSTAYCATKGAVELLVKSLAVELAPGGVRVNAVAPGNVRTSINAHLLADPDYHRQMLAATPAGRIGEVEDIAPAVAYLASPAAAYVQGVSLLVDGGWAAQ
ncbi:MAG: SDR family oxidoreductase [Actinobacteria bacterium]|nr:SDR family oxidoreductase [Actinomycetota bacterium]